MSKPLANGLGIQFDNAIVGTHYVIKWSFIVPLLVVALTATHAYYHAVERSHFFMFCVDMAGIPGLFLALLVLVSK